MEMKRKRENGGQERPRKDEPTQTVYRVKVEFAEDKSVIEKEKNAEKGEVHRRYERVGQRETE